MSEQYTSNNGTKVKSYSCGYTGNMIKLLHVLFILPQEMAWQFPCSNLPSEKDGNLELDLDFNPKEHHLLKKIIIRQLKKTQWSHQYLCTWLCNICDSYKAPSIQDISSSDKLHFIPVNRQRRSYFLCRQSTQSFHVFFFLTCFAIRLCIRGNGLEPRDHK